MELTDLRKNPVYHTAYVLSNTLVMGESGVLLGDSLGFQEISGGPGDAGDLCRSFPDHAASRAELEDSYSHGLSHTQPQLYLYCKEVTLSHSHTRTLSHSHTLKNISPQQSCIQETTQPLKMV